MTYRFLTKLLFFAPFCAQAQPDSLRVMTYNLTNYGNPQTGCTSANNGPAVKNPEFKNIMKYVMPDIMSANELNTNPVLANGFLTNVLNTDGITYYKRSASVVESGTLTSMIFYNSDKLVLAQQFSVQTTTRLTPHCRFYLKTTELANGDTIWINTLSTHLKAGTATSDQTERAAMTQTIRTYLNNWPKKENFMIMGDFNVYKSSEQAWINLTSTGTQAAFQFIDPVNRVGTWNNNASFSDVHTQCPSISGNSCFSGGGLDDRFDFMLMNRHLLNDSGKIKYVPGTYHPIGNDGQHFNKAITDAPTNNSVPATVLNSLYVVSDHLPVMAKLQVNGTFVTANHLPFLSQDLQVRLIDHSLIFNNLGQFSEGEVSLWNMAGREIAQTHLRLENGEASWNPGTLASGIYLVHIKTNRGNGTVKVWKE